MNIQTILLPHKHVRFCDSLLGLAGFIRSLLHDPYTLDELWALIDRDHSDWMARPSFTHVVMALNILFTLKQIELNSEGSIRNPYGN